MRTEPFGTGTFWVAILAGVVVACVVAAIFSFFMRRASEFYLAIATLGLSEIILEVLRRWLTFTGAEGDVTAGIKPIDYWFGHTVSQLNQYAQFWVWFVAFAIAMIVWSAKAGSSRSWRQRCSRSVRISSLTLCPSSSNRRCR